MKNKFFVFMKAAFKCFRLICNVVTIVTFISKYSGLIS